jgi:hypothetical protein
MREGTIASGTVVDLRARWSRDPILGACMVPIERLLVDVRHACTAVTFDHDRAAWASLNELPTELRERIGLYPGITLPEAVQKLAAYARSAF